MHTATDRLGMLHSLLCNGLHSSDQNTRWLISLKPHKATVSTVWHPLHSLWNDQGITPLLKNISLCWVYKLGAAITVDIPETHGVCTAAYPLTSFPLRPHTSTHQVIQ